MLKEIYQRQSIRRYKDQKVEKEKIEELLRAAMNAPTARNLQTWRFLVVEDRETLNDMAELKSFTSMMKTATCAIIVMGDQKRNPVKEYLYLDGAAAIENMLIEGVHQGLGSCWCAIGPNEDRIASYREYFHIEEDLLPIAVVAFGYGDEVKEKEDRYDSSKVEWYERG